MKNKDGHWFCLLSDSNLKDAVEYKPLQISKSSMTGQDRLYAPNNLAFPLYLSYCSFKLKIILSLIKTSFSPCISSNGH